MSLRLGLGLGLGGLVFGAPGSLVRKYSDKAVGFTAHSNLLGSTCLFAARIDKYRRAMS